MDVRLQVSNGCGAIFRGALLLTAASVLFAGTRTLKGTVTFNGKPVERAVVKLEDPKTLQVRSFYTGKDGHYHFAALRTEFDYEVWAERGNQKSSKEYFSRFNSDPTPTVDLDLK